VTNDVSALVTALIAVCAIGFVMRWVFQSGRPHHGVPVDAAASGDLGMLDVVAAGRTRQEALLLRATLGQAGIRSSMSRRHDGNLDVLVFHDDVERARALLDSR
jgi:hypothetical protein